MGYFKSYFRQISLQQNGDIFTQIKTKYIAPAQLEVEIIF